MLQFSKFGKTKDILIIVVAVVAILVVSGYFIVAKKTTTSTNIISKGNVILKGTVISNYIGCASDDQCVLVMQTDDGRKINAYYGGGLTPDGACYLGEGLQLVQGDRVEIFGRVVDQNNLSVCEPGSYIHKK